MLPQPQRDTIYCLLSCVSTVTSLCPHREDEVLQRLMRALTKVRQMWECAGTCWTVKPIQCFWSTAPSTGNGNPCNFDEDPEGQFERSVQQLQIRHEDLEHQFSTLKSRNNMKTYLLLLCFHSWFEKHWCFFCVLGYLIVGKQV